CAGIALENSMAWVILDLACIQAGIVTVPLPPFFTAAQCEHALHTSGAALLFTDKPGRHTGPVFVTHGRPVWLESLQNEAVVLPAGTEKITYTSGTTGKPKGVCLSQQGMEQVAGSLVEVIGKKFAAHTAAVLPLAVLLENIAGCYATFMAGGCYDIQPQAEIGFTRGMIPDFGQLSRYLRASQAQSCILVPELLRGLMQALLQSKQNLPAMKFIAVGGSRVAPSLLEQAERLGLPVYEGYGLSEAASVVAVNTPAQQLGGSVGRVLPHIEVDFAADGEILLRQPAFLGYVGEAKQAGSYPTGDLGRLDDEGYLHITGRKKNIIINAMGRNISPEWPESELLAQPQVAQTIVFGDADAELGALIVPSSAQLDASQLAAAVANANRQLPEYAQIRHWRVTTPFTIANQQLTGTGRPRRDVILKANREQISQMTSAA
ncbi:MAG: AMP-binding protein, partial [Granulosicoccaceae bacterium]